MSGIFELQVTEDTIATNTQKMYLVKRQLAEEKSAKRKTASRQKRLYHTYSQLLIEMFPNNSADLALILISVQTAGEKIVKKKDWSVA